MSNPSLVSAHIQRLPSRHKALPNSPLRLYRTLFNIPQVPCLASPPLPPLVHPLLCVRRGDWLRGWHGRREGGGEVVLGSERAAGFRGWEGFEFRGRGCWLRCCGRSPKPSQVKLARSYLSIGKPNHHARPYLLSMVVSLLLNRFSLPTNPSITASSLSLQTLPLKLLPLSY